LFIGTIVLFLSTVIAIVFFIDKKNDKKETSHLIIFSPYFLLICGMIIGMILGFFLADLIKPDNQKLDEGFDIIHNAITRNIGAQEIAAIANNSTSIPDKSEQLIFIADHLVENFTDPNWGFQQNNDTFCYYPNENISFDYCLLKYDSSKKLREQALPNIAYMFDKHGKVRQYWKESYGGFILRTDPYWIAYQKTGECQELSILFNETASQAGFETRIIRSDGNGHFWNEVKINGTWKFFDLQQYGGINDRKNISHYFGNTAEYAKTIPWNLCDMINNGKKPGIFVYDLKTDAYGENRNDAYDPNHICKK
jgi:hypothetical protein